MNITLTNFRSQMFKLLPQIENGEIITITHKRHEYALLSTEKLRKLKLIDGLNDIPAIHLNRDEIRNAIEEGRR